MNSEGTGDPIENVRGHRFEIMAENFDQVYWMFTADFSELLYVNDRVHELYGLTPADLEEDPTLFLKMIHPGDRDGVTEAMNQLQDGQTVNREYRTVPEEGQVRWIEAEGVPISGDDGSTDKLIGASREITERKEAEREMQEERNRFESLVYLQEAIVKSDLNTNKISQTVVDELLTLTNADGAAIELVDVEKLTYRAASGTLSEFIDLELDVTDSLSGACYRDGEIKLANDVNQDERVDDETLKQEKFPAGSMLMVPLEYAEERFGVLKIVHEAPHKLDTSDQHVLNMLAGMLGASMYQAMQYEDKQKYLKQVQDMAYTDPLTGLDNRRALMNQLEDEIQRSRRYPHALTFGILDLDHFKKVNDEYGHPVGDEVLREIAGVLRTETRDIDTVGRYGGEEFALVLPETSLKEAQGLTQRLLQSIRENKFEVNGLRQDVTASMGICELQEGESQEEFIKRADDALYEAKFKGRDGYVTG